MLGDSQQSQQLVILCDGRHMSVFDRSGALKCMGDHCGNHRGITPAHELAPELQS